MFAFMLWSCLLLVLSSVFWSLCPSCVCQRQVIQYYWPSRSTEQNAQQIPHNFYSWRPTGSLLHELFQYQWYIKPNLLAVLVQDTFLGYFSYRVTGVQHVYCFDDKVENCRQENRKQKWNFSWNAFISISHTDHITAPECGFSTFSLLSSLVPVVWLPK